MMRRSSSTLPFRQLLRSNSPALRPATGVVDGSRRLLHNRGGQPAGKLISTSCTPRPVGVVALRGGFRRALASQVPPEADERANKPKKVNIDVDEMFATPEDSGQHWLQMTINDDWERAPEGPDMTEPADLNLAKYLGTLDERGLPTGRGKLFSQDNQEGISIYYFGEFKNGKFHGRGRSVNIEHIELTKEERNMLPKNVYQWTGKEKLLQLGTVYEGNWEEGMMHGKGRLTSRDGSVYEGDFSMGQRTGLAKMISDEGYYFYTGEFEDGAYHGKGTLRSKAGDQFEGEFERGMMRQGKGKMVLEEGFIYEGEIFDGAPSGYGKQYHPNKKEGYEGHFNDGEYQGRGKLLTPDGSFVEGTFDKGMLDGPATHFDANGNATPMVFKRGVPQQA